MHAVKHRKPNVSWTCILTFLVANDQSELANDGTERGGDEISGTVIMPSKVAGASGAWLGVLLDFTSFAMALQSGLYVSLRPQAENPPKTKLRNLRQARLADWDLTPAR
jgi:hypothetical protein